MTGRTGQFSVSGHLGDSRVPLFGFWFFCALSAFFVGGPWAGFHSAMFLSAGAIMVLFPPVARIPKLWLLLAAGFGLASLTAFLPAAWFPTPAWRAELEALGVDTGPHVAVQARQAAEFLGILLLTFVAGLWISGHRAGPATLRAAALAFVTGVAFYAVASRILQDSGTASTAGRYGFFPNRNHSATYLAMGSIAGLGCLLQSLRDRRFVLLAVALVATGVCLWGVAAWSVSRAGIVLVLVGAVLWLGLMGTRYLGGNGLKALALIALAGIGLFLVTESGVKERLGGTVERATGVLSPEAEEATAGGVETLDFRIPTALDTLGMIRQFPWTGVGAGQFLYVFPQYRQRAAVANDADSFHPESDWLWLAAETGVPAAFALLVLVVAAAVRSARGIRAGRDRALRAACLAAALLVAIHGIFDVPGHRLTLAWSAAFLFALSLRPRDEMPALRTAGRLSCRLGGALLLAAGFMLASAEWRGRPRLAMTLGGETAGEVWKVYREDVEARRDGPPPEVDLLEKSLVTLEAAAEEVPMDRKIRYLQGFVALHYEELGKTADRGFAIERLLEPRRVAVPLRQALAWSNADPERSAGLWMAALRRADWMDAHHPGSAWEKKRILQQIDNSTRGREDLEKIFRKLDHPALNQ